MVYIFLLSSLFSSPNLSGRRLDVYHTSTHGVALVRIQNACLKCAAGCSLKKTGRKKSPFWHHRTTLSGCIFAAEACINNPEKNLLNIDTSSTCLRNMVNVGLLTDSSRGRQPNFAALNRGRHVYCLLYTSPSPRD